MSGSVSTVPWPANKYRWLLWLAYLTAWTVGLLMPMREHSVWKLGAINLKLVAAKGLHVAAYAGLAMLSGWLLVSSRFRWLLMWFMAAHAAATELGQQYVPGRTGSIRDICIDLFGIALGCVLTWKWWTGDRLAHGSSPSQG